jgi:hypothetical protein
VIVLHQDQGRLGLDLVGHCRREPRVHFTVCLEVTGPEDRRDTRAMTQRPEPLIGEAVVIAALLDCIQPDPAKPVLGVPQRHIDTVALVHDGSIGRAGAVSHPDS